MRSKSHAFFLVIALLAVSLAAPLAAADTAPHAGDPQGKPAQRPDDPLKPNFQCCQYLCSDATGDYRYQTCSSASCLDLSDRRCILTGTFTVDSCKECPHELRRGQGDGGCYGKPEKEGEAVTPPGGGGGSGGTPKRQ